MAASQKFGGVLGYICPEVLGDQELAVGWDPTAPFLKQESTVKPAVLCVTRDSILCKIPVGNTVAAPVMVCDRKHLTTVTKD